MIRFALIYILFFGFISKGLSQTDGEFRQVSNIGTIKGQVLDAESHKPMSFAQISLFNVSSDKLVDGAIADKDGFFSISNIQVGKYYILIKFIGYEKKKVNSLEISKDKPVYDLGKVELMFTNYETDGVEVTAEKPHVEFKMDKKIVNVSRNLISQGGTAVNALENVPSIKVDIEGNVTMRGSSNFTVYINGKPSVLQGSDVLEQIPASAIDNIEIITNPSAKYDPDGIGGIININMKKEGMMGLSGMFDISVGTRDKYNTNLLLNYKLPDLALFMGLDFNDNKHSGDAYSEKIFYMEDSTLHIESDMLPRRIRYGYTLKGGIAYEIGQKQTLSLEGNYGLNGFKRTHYSNKTSWVDETPVYSYFINDNVFSRSRDFYSMNFDYFLKFDRPGEQLSANIYLSNRTAVGQNKQDEFLSDDNWKIYNSNFSIKTNEDEVSEEYRFKIDYILPFNKDNKFETGFQSRVDRENEVFTFWDKDSSGNFGINDFFSNKMGFYRDIHSLYSSYAGIFSKFSYQVGLRGEYTLRKIDVDKDDKEYRTDRLDYFPTIHLTQDLGSSHQLLASYSRRINRPRGWDLDPFPVYFDAENYRVGNPDLQPEYIDSYEFGYQKYFGVSYVSLESYYRITNNKITRLKQRDGEKILNTVTNLDDDNSLGLELTVNYEPVKWLRLNASGNYYKYRLNGIVFDSLVTQSSNVWDVRFNATYMFNQNTRVQFDGYYQGPQISIQGDTKGYYVFGAAIRHEFWNRQASLTLQARDLFSTMKWEFSSRTESLYTFDIRDRESPVVTLTFSYKLNNFQKKKEQRLRENGDMDDGF